MSDEYITPTALCAERNWSRSKVALLGQPDKTLRISGAGGKTGSLFAMSRVIAIEQEHKPFKSENRRRASLSVALLQSRINPAAKAFIRGRSPV